jgi:hypothetical protein
LLSSVLSDLDLERVSLETTSLVLAWTSWEKLAAEKRLWGSCWEVGELPILNLDNIIIIIMGACVAKKDSKGPFITHLDTIQSIVKPFKPLDGGIDQRVETEKGGLLAFTQRRKVQTVPGVVFHDSEDEEQERQLRNANNPFHQVVVHPSQSEGPKDGDPKIDVKSENFLINLGEIAKTSCLVSPNEAPLAISSSAVKLNVNSNQKRFNFRNNKVMSESEYKYIPNNFKSKEGVAFPVAFSKINMCAGLSGIYNMGNTCFFSTCKL